MPQMALESEVLMAEGKNGDDRLLVKFFHRPMLNDEKSKAEGRPIYDDVEYVEIKIPGDKDNDVCRAVRESDKERFARRYMAWKQTGEQAESGTPLSAVTFLTRAQVEEMKFFNVSTVEQLANLADSNAAKFMGLQGLKQKAASFLAAAAGEAPMLKMQAELQGRDDKIAAMEQQMKEQSRKIDELLKNRR